MTALVYWPGLNGPLVFDDTYNLAPIKEWLRGDRDWQWVVFNNTSGVLGRSVSMASFVANIALLGPGIWGLKLGNLVLHLLNGALVFFLFRGMLRRDTLTRPQPDAAYWVPLVGAAIWLMHPLLVSTVLYVVQRMAMLSTFFTLLTLLAYLHGRMAIENGRRRLGWLALGITVPAFTLLATLSKENGILAPALCALVEWFAFAPKDGQRRARLPQAFVICALAIPAVLTIVLTMMQLPAIVDGYQNRPFTLSERLLTQPRVLWSYVYSLLLPQGPTLGLYHDDYVVSTGLLSPPQTLFAILAWAGLIVAAWRARRRIPGFSFGVAFFLIAHSLESSVFPLLMYFEHRNYLPAIGAIWALLSLLGYAANRLARHMHHGSRVFAAGSLTLIAAFALATAARAGIWSSKDTLLTQSLRHHPNSISLRTDLAQYALQALPPDYRTARQQFDSFVLSPESETRRLAHTWQLMIDCASGSGATQTSLTGAFQGTVVAIEPDQLLAYEALADGVKAKGCPNLTPVTLADEFVDLLTRTRIDNAHYHARRLRFKAAQLYVSGGLTGAAAEQAHLADSGTAVDAPMAAFAAELEISRGNIQAANALIARLEVQIPREDRTGRRVLFALKEAARQAAPQGEHDRKAAKE